MKELSGKISTALNEIFLIKTKLIEKNQCDMPVDDQQPNIVGSLPRDGPISPEIRVVEVDEVELSLESQNMSTSSANTIDEHVNTNDYLNSRVPTNQLPQLVQQNP